MMWQYIVVGVVLAVALCLAVVKMLSPSKKCPPGQPLCAGCSLANTCKKSVKRSSTPMNKRPPVSPP